MEIFRYIIPADHPYISYEVEVGRPQRQPSDQNVPKVANRPLAPCE